MLNSEQDKYIEELYIEMFYPLSAYARSALSDKYLAEEAVQETFRIACVKVDTLNASSNPKGWLMKTLKYVIMNMKRSRSRLNRFMMCLMSAYENNCNQISPNNTLCYQYKNIISKEDFDLLKGIAVDGYSTKEMADELEISVDACRKRYRRAKIRLKDAIGNDT